LRLLGHVIPQRHSPHVAFLVHGLALGADFRVLERDWLAANHALEWRSGCGRSNCYPSVTLSPCREFRSRQFSESFIVFAEGLLQGGENRVQLGLLRRYSSGA
jgi:hypothetical protein